MAAADLFVMAIYFAFLTYAIQDEGLINMFRNKNNSKSIDENEVEIPSAAEPTDNESLVFSVRAKVAGTLLAIVSALSMSTFANRMEKIINPIIPGTACAIIALMGTLYHRLNKSTHTIWKSMEKSSSAMAGFAFQLFFAAIGMSANIDQALKTGPACLFFSAFALVIHIILSFFGCLIANRFNKLIQLKHVLVASNAAIGGPATAAAFAGQFKTGLTLPATVWGVVGYAIGTNLGVGMVKFLMRLIL